MKLVEIEITGVRGIPKLKHKIALKNFAVFGPNGSGKSGLVDSIDFLLTGQVKRLTGQGTGSLSLKTHGPHINHKIAMSSVRALVQVEEVAEPIEISRKMATPLVLDVAEEHRAIITKYIEVAKRGHHVLTRRDLLRFVTAEDSTRATDIQALLNLGDIEGLRKQFTGAQKDIAAKIKDRLSILNQKHAAVNAITGLNKFDSDSALKAANVKREELGLQLAVELTKTSLLAGMNNVVETKAKVSWQLVCAPLVKLRESINQRNELLKPANDFVEKLNTLRKDPALLKAYSQLRLTELGLDAISDESCPLCDEQWSIEELKEHLAEKLKNGKAVQKHLDDLDELGSDLKTALRNAHERIESVRQNAQAADLNDLLGTLGSWASDIKIQMELLDKPMEGSNADYIKADKLTSLAAPTEWDSFVDLCSEKLKKAFPEESPEAAAREYLSRLAAAIEMLEDAISAHERACEAGVQATKLLDAFTKARDGLLEQLYQDVAGRFAELYRFINEEDEGSFKAELKPDGAGVSMRVDFYGHGMHPPHALHSEGHQDSMGLCLYLALMEKLTEGAIGIVVLDDVVMSIDSDHRRKICELLKGHFANRQLIITTHDKVWANQLKTLGIIGSENLMVFSGWDVELGPHVELAAEVWKRMENDLAIDQVPAAAARLRRFGEEYFSAICEDLIATVPCKQDGRWEFGELLQSASSRLKALLKAGIESAQSWGHEEIVSRLTELEKARSISMKFFTDEQGVINQTVHFNYWVHLSSSDFKPVVEAFKTVTAIFRCPKCDSVLVVLQDGKKDKMVSCSCGTGGWNLIKRSK